MKRVLLPCLVAAMVAGTAVAAKPIVIGEIIARQSVVMGEARTILVSTPPGYERGRDAFPVLYLLDGDAHLTHTRGTVDFLAASGLVPQMIIVGVVNTDRTRDLTPTEGTVPDGDGAERQVPGSGGATRFLEFFERELLPFIDSGYRTLPYRVVCGHSLGGLFALEALFRRPEMFDAVIAVSPTLCWDHGLPIRQARAFFEGRRRCKAMLLVTMANEERDERPPTGLDRLQAVLAEASTRDFEWQVLRMPEETHASTALDAYEWGLRRVFDSWRFPHDAEDGRFSGTLADLEQHFARLSKKLGVTLAPREQVVDQIGRDKLEEGDPDEAIAFFRYNVRLFPDSANAHSSLGEALERAGRRQEALKSYTKAVETAQKTLDDRLPAFRADRDRLRAQLAAAGNE